MLWAIHKADSKSFCFLAVLCLQTQRWGTLHVCGGVREMSSCAHTGKSDIEADNLLLLSVVYKQPGTASSVLSISPGTAFTKYTLNVSVS